MFVLLKDVADVREGVLNTLPEILGILPQPLRDDTILKL